MTDILNNNEMNVKILNYQRVRSGELTFVPGLNVIVGKTNQGKTAILRALETAIFNIPRESHITNGETKSAVGIKYNNHEVIWRRDKTAASQVSYRVDGKIYNKVGRGQFDVVADALGIREIELNDKKIRVNFGKQMTYPFLLDATPSELFKFIVQSGEEDNVTKVLDNMKKDFMTMKSNVKAYETTKDSLGIAYNKAVEEYKEVHHQMYYADRILALDTIVNEYKALKEQLETFEKANSLLRDHSASLDKWKNVFRQLDNSLLMVKGAKEKLDNLYALNLRYEESKSTVETCNTALQESIALQSKLARLPQMRYNLNNVIVTESRKSTIEQAIAQLKTYMDVIEVSSTQLETAKKYLDDVEYAKDKVQDRLKDLKVLESTIASLKEESLNVYRYQKSVEDLELRKVAGERIIDEVMKELAQFGYCPHCGSKLENGACIKED